MATHIVKQGECLSSIARHYGLPSWRTIYDHPNNAGFRAKRPDPNLIYPGDQLFIPGLEPREENASTDKRTTFRTTREGVRLAIRVHDEEGNAVANAKFRILAIDTQTEHTGSTNVEGIAEAPIPDDAEHAQLEVWPQGQDNAECWRWDILIGHLDPLDTVSGHQARLNNLGYDSGDVDGIKGPITEAAIKAFQTDEALEPDGIVGPKTTNAFRDTHGV